MVKVSCLIGLFVTALVVAMGCGEARGFGLKAEPEHPVMVRPIEVLTRSTIRHYGGATLGLVRFQGPPAQEEVTEKIAWAYMKEFSKLGVFREVKNIPQTVQNDQEAIWLSRKEGCDLVVTATVLYVLGGSGAMPTHLQIDVRILDARLDKAAWHLQQSAMSEPGQDRDFFWSTRVGVPAHGIPMLAEALASQLSAYLVEPTSNP